ncbi:hypothetical protein Tco_1257161, partial [Tanacetum coccineum]
LFSIMTLMCYDDAYRVTPRVSALAGYDRLVSEPLVKKNSPERIHEVESEQDPEEDLKEDLEEEEESKKKRLKEASESDSNTLPPDYTAPNEETETDLDFTARCETKHEELKNTCESSIQSKPDSPHTVPAYMLSDYSYH